LRAGFRSGDRGPVRRCPMSCRQHRAPRHGCGPGSSKTRSTVQVHSACAAQYHAAPEFGSGHAEDVTQHTQERDVAIDLNKVGCAIDFLRERLASLRVRTAEPAQGGRSHRFKLDEQATCSSDDVDATFQATGRYPPPTPKVASERSPAGLSSVKTRVDLSNACRRHTEWPQRTNGTFL
jgi:hypothetical protein